MSEMQPHTSPLFSDSGSINIISRPLSPPSSHNHLLPFSCFSSDPTSPPDWLTVCCVYFGLQGDVGLPGPSGTPGDGSLTSEQTLTIYKGDKVTRQKREGLGADDVAQHTHTHTHKNTWMWWDFTIKVVQRR